MIDKYRSVALSWDINRMDTVCRSLNALVLRLFPRDHSHRGCLSINWLLAVLPVNKWKHAPLTSKKLNLVLVGLSRWASSCLQQNAPLGHSSLVPNCTSLGTSNKINKPWSMNHDKSYTLLFDSLCYFVWHASLDWSKIPACFMLLDIPVSYPYHPIDSIRNYLWVVFVNIQCCSLDSWYLRSVWRVVWCHSYLFMVQAIYARVTKICWQAPNFPSFGHLVFSFSALRTFVLPPRRAWKPMGGRAQIA